MQVVGKKVELHSHRRSPGQNGSLTGNDCIKKKTNMEQISALLRLPVELVYRIFDHLDVQTIIFSLRHVCKQFRETVKHYDRYFLDFDLISIHRLRYIRRLIQPEVVISLSLSDDVKTPKQIEYFLSLFNLRRFTRLRSLIVTQHAKDLFNIIFDHVFSCQSLLSFSIYFRPTVEFESKESYYYDLTGPSLGPLASVLVQSKLKKFETNLQLYQWDKILRPIQYSFQHLTIGHCTRKQYYMILRHSPHLRTMIMERIKMKDHESISDNEVTDDDEFIHDLCHPLISLTLLKHKRSIFDLEQSLLLTPMLMHLKIVGEMDENTFLMDSSRLEEFIRGKLCLLKRLEIFISSFTYDDNFSIDTLIEPFHAPFWTEEKHWFFTCELFGIGKRFSSIQHQYQRSMPLIISTWIKLQYLPLTN